MTPELSAQVAVSQRLDRMEATLRRICFELDLAINGIRHILTAQGHKAVAEDIAEQLEQAHQERREADADTLPPDAS